MALSTRLIFRAALMRNAAILSPKLAAAHRSLSETTGSVSQSFTCRFLSTSRVHRCAQQTENLEDSKLGVESDAQAENGAAGGKRKRAYSIHSYETSLRYMKSNAYKRAYGDEPVWKPYRRNFKGQFAPETRATCVRKGAISTGSPCPICRDEYLVVHHQNPTLLDQFMSPTTGKLLPSIKTGVCQEVQFKLELEIMKAHDIGTLQYEVPFRRYDYEEFYPQLKTRTGNEPK